MKDKVQPKPKTPQGFADAYQKLCEEWGFHIVITPAFRARDDGTWSLVLQTSVGKLQRPEQA